MKSDDVLDLRFLVFKPTVNPRRAYWQPDDGLRGAGWEPARLARGVPLEDLKRAAAAECDKRNKEVDAWREGACPPLVAAGVVSDPVSAKEPGTLGWLIMRYEAPENDDFHGLRDKTRASYRKNLRVLERWAGTERLVLLTAKRWKKLYKGLYKATPSLANAVLGMGSILWEWGIGEELAPRPLPMGEITRKGVPFTGLVWPRAAIDAFVEAADRLGRPSIGTAVLVDSVIGQRQADVLRLPRNVLRENGIVVRQEKGGRSVPLPIHASDRLRARLEAELQRTAKLAIVPTRLITSEATGEQYKQDDFRHQFAEIRKALAEGDAEHGIAAQPSFVVDFAPAGAEPDGDGNYRVRTVALQFMHLRHTAVTGMAERFCDVQEISAISGHSLASVTQILERYLVRTRRQAASAFAKLNAGEPQAIAKQGEQG